MERAATEVMQSIVFSAVLDCHCGAEVRFRRPAQSAAPRRSGIHANVTFADLPKELQDAIAASTRSAFTQLLKEGYAVGPRQQMQTTRPMDRVPERDRGRRRTAEPCATARAGAARRATRTAKARAMGRAGDLAVRRAGRRPSRPRKPPKGKPRLS
jgi:hypothetical protein